MKLVLAAMLAVAVALLLGTPPPSARAQGPVVVSQFPKEGDILGEQPARLPETPVPAGTPVAAESVYGIQLCFAEPVDVRDNDKGGLHDFAVRGPNGSQLAMRVAFQGDGFGVIVSPGLAQEPVEGEWTLEWMVRDPDTLEEASGEVHFQVRSGGSPVPSEAPSACGGTPGPQVSPAAGTTPGATPTATATATPGEEAENGGNGLDAWVIVVIVVAAVAAAALAGVAVYWVRRRAGQP